MTDMTGRRYARAWQHVAQRENPNQREVVPTVPPGPLGRLAASLVNLAVTAASYGVGIGVVLWYRLNVHVRPDDRTFTFLQAWGVGSLIVLGYVIIASAFSGRSIRGRRA